MVRPQVFGAGLGDAGESLGDDAVGDVGSLNLQGRVLVPLPTLSSDDVKVAGRGIQRLVDAANAVDDLKDAIEAGVADFA